MVLREYFKHAEIGQLTVQQLHILQYTFIIYNCTNYDQQHTVCDLSQKRWVEPSQPPGKSYPDCTCSKISPAYGWTELQRIPPFNDDLAYFPIKVSSLKMNSDRLEDLAEPLPSPGS